MNRIAGRFVRVEPRRRVGRLVLGLLSDLPRKNCWTIAEWAGESTPDGMQHLLSRARWDADAVRDDMRHPNCWIKEARHRPDRVAAHRVHARVEVKAGKRSRRRSAPATTPMNDLGQIDRAGSRLGRSLASLAVPGQMLGDLGPHPQASG